MIKKIILYVTAVTIAMSFMPAFSEQTVDAAPTQKLVKKHHAYHHQGLSQETRDQWRKEEHPVMKQKKSKD